MATRRQTKKAVVAPKKAKRKRSGRRSIPGTFTQEKQIEFLQHFETGLTVAQAARKIGVSRVTVFNHVRNDEEFKAGYHRSREISTDCLEDTMHDMARNGNVAALFGILKNRRPETWRDRVDLSNQDGSLLKPLAEAIRRAHGIGGGSGPGG